MNEKILSYKGYVAGWLDSSIHDFLEVLPPTAASTKYALITCLDSHRNPASLRGKSPELKSIVKKTEIRGAGLLLPTELLLRTEASSRILFGFDEVWFCKSKSIDSQAPAGSLVGPSRLNQRRLERLGEWMEANGCSLALGGGEGLNFVVRAHGLVRLLLGYSIEQPHPALLSA